MHKRLSYMFGALFTLGLGSVLAGASPWLLLPTALIGFLAARWFVAHMAQQFHDLVNEIAPLLPTDWRGHARRAEWPQNLEIDHVGGAVGWVLGRAETLRARERHMLEMARNFYKWPDAPHRPCDKAVNEMRHLADAFARLGYIGLGSRGFLSRRVNREVVILLAYLQLALAEKLHALHSTSGELTAWVWLGDQWPKLREPEDVKMRYRNLPKLPPPVPLPPVKFSALGSGLSLERRLGLEETLDVHFLLDAVLLGREREPSDAEPWQLAGGHLVTFHDLAITNRSGDDMSLDLTASLALIKPSMFMGETSVDLTPIKLENRNVPFHHGVLVVRAKQTVTVNVAFALDMADALKAMRLDNIREDGHSLVMSDRVSGKVREQPFKVWLSSPSEPSSEEPDQKGGAA